MATAEPVRPTGHKSVQSLLRAFELLEGLARLDGEASLQQLQELTHLPAPTIHRILNTLVETGYVRRSAHRSYALGARLLWLAENANKSFGASARPFLSTLMNKTGETANLAVLERDDVVYLDQVPSTKHQMRMFTEVGRRVLPHSSGVGKAMLSQLPVDQVRALLQRTGMPAYTEHTHTDAAEFMRHLAEIAERGYALDENEHELGVRCVAAPLAHAPVPAAISVSGPEGRLTRDVACQIAPIVVNVASSFSTHLTAHDPETRDGLPLSAPTHISLR